MSNTVIIDNIHYDEHVILNILIWDDDNNNNNNNNVSMQ